jgi:hypothetical protein
LAAAIVAATTTRLGNGELPWYVVRGGLATPQNLIAGSGTVDDPYSHLTGFSVQSAPGLTIDQLAAAGRYRNPMISYTTVQDLANIGIGIALTPFPERGYPYHATVLVGVPLGLELATRISQIFVRIPNPAQRR